MKVYLVKRNDKIDWDEYDAFVVIARDEQDAVHLSHAECGEYGGEFRSDNTSVTEITPSDAQRGIVLGSFNAG